MTRISCEVARDLLPLYCDDVCSQESRILIDEHLKKMCIRDSRLLHTNINASRRAVQNQYITASSNPFSKYNLLFISTG